MNLFSTIYRLNKWYVIRLQELCSTHDITPVQWLVLHHIDENDNCTSMDIVKEWSVEKPTVSSLVRKLSEQHLIQFTSGKDKRQKYLSLTTEGKTRYEEIAKKVMELQTFVTEPFSDQMVNEWTEQLMIAENRMKLYQENSSNKGGNQNEF
ncbi:MarR family transcriptional regulator [Gracilibacillus caseinilyticus]|uniref:MarR family transcriptional regulator n=1 Tax=Gracilibacillus caseinilyticus TaxID=2932256 RepID=A0ABY4EXN7_9BACI|nr:MarR family transcriptional regulator [Gracilibacillus caseinilyticus]UOQ49176.1 MarR family transcriptional regulator [Gracilibacillus caseinilyticus]